MLGQPLQLGTVSIPNRAILAPLAGVTDVPFRRICQEAGAGLTYVEMLSAAAVLIGSEQTLRMICRHPRAFSGQSAPARSLTRPPKPL